MPIKLRKSDIANRIDNPKEGYIILGFDETGTLVYKDENGITQSVVPSVSTGVFDNLEVQFLTIGNRVIGETPGALYSIGQGINVIGNGLTSFARGEDVEASGYLSYVSGTGVNPANRLVSDGVNSFVHCVTNDTSKLGSLSDYSVILGGQNHNIGLGSDNSIILGGYNNSIGASILNSVILGGSGITATQSNTVYVHNIQTRGMINLYSETGYWVELKRTTGGTTNKRSYSIKEISQSIYIQSTNESATVVRDLLSIKHDGGLEILNGDLTFYNNDDKLISIEDGVTRTLTIKGNYNSDGLGGHLKLEGGFGDDSGGIGGNIYINGGIGNGISNGNIYIGTGTTNAIYLGNATTITTGTPGANEVLYVDTTDNYRIKRGTVSGGGGDVTKVGTPVNNQVGVWTGDGTIKGTTGFTWNEYSMSIDGDVNSSRGFIHTYFYLGTYTSSPISLSAYDGLNYKFDLNTASSFTLNINNLKDGMFGTIIVNVIGSARTIALGTFTDVDSGTATKYLNGSLSSIPVGRHIITWTYHNYLSTTREIYFNIGAYASA